MALGVWVARVFGFFDYGKLKEIDLSAIDVVTGGIEYSNQVET